MDMRNYRWYRVTQRGTRPRFNTADDLIVWLEARSRMGVESAGNGISAGRSRKIRLRCDWSTTVGPDNGLAEIAGTVTDVTWRSRFSGARVQILRIETEKGSRNAVADAAGRFSFAALPPGRYRVRVESPGFRGSVRTISLAARDHGVLSAS